METVTSGQMFTENKKISTRYMQHIPCVALGMAGKHSELQIVLHALTKLGFG